jgi:hypothetical protein
MHKSAPYELITPHSISIYLWLMNDKPPLILMIYFNTSEYFDSLGIVFCLRNGMYMHIRLANRQHAQYTAPVMVPSGVLSLMLGACAAQRMSG